MAGMNRDEIVDTAKSLISGDRQAVYGSARDSFTRIGVMFGATLGIPAVAPSVVALLLAQLKIARAVSAPGHADSYVDLAGYAALAGELATLETDA